LGGFADERAGVRKAGESGYVCEDGEESVSNLFELGGGIGVGVGCIEAGVQLKEGQLQEFEIASIQKHCLQDLEGEIGQGGGTYLHKRVQVGIVSLADRKTEKESRCLGVGKLRLRVWFPWSVVQCLERYP
jgi:hypothetical protein